MRTLDELESLVGHLEALADPEQEVTPSYENTDWRGLANTCAHALRELIADAERLDDALTHLHWLCVGGEFANEVPEKTWRMASLKELEQARDFLRATRKARSARKG